MMLYLLAVIGAVALGLFLVLIAHIILTEEPEPATYEEET